MKYLKVKNWAEFQHYKDRNPPWIKLHRALLDDYEFSRLQDASKAHLMLIWLFASQKDGVIPADPAFLKKKLGLQREPDLKLFIDHGLLIPEQDATNALAEGKQSAPLEEERREEKKERAFALPAWVPTDAWKGWLEVRQKVKAPNTDRALELAVKELERLRGEGQDPRVVLETATVKGWRGLFPVKSNSQPVVGEVI